MRRIPELGDRDRPGERGERGERAALRGDSEEPVDARCLSACSLPECRGCSTSEPVPTGSARVITVVGVEESAPPVVRDATDTVPVAAERTGVTPVRGAGVSGFSRALTSGLRRTARGDTGRATSVRRLLAVTLVVSDRAALRGGMVMPGTATVAVTLPTPAVDDDAARRVSASGTTWRSCNTGRRTAPGDMERARAVVEPVVVGAPRAAGPGSVGVARRLSRLLLLLMVEVSMVQQAVHADLPRLGDLVASQTHTHTRTRTRRHYRCRQTGKPTRVALAPSDSTPRVVEPAE